MKITIAPIRKEAKRVYGSRFVNCYDGDTGHNFWVELTGNRDVCFYGKSRMDARRFAYEELCRTATFVESP